MGRLKRGQDGSMGVDGDQPIQTVEGQIEPACVEDLWNQAAVRHGCSSLPQ
jgi:hypothetical protein